MATIVTTPSTVVPIKPALTNCSSSTTSLLTSSEKINTCTTVSTSSPSLHFLLHINQLMVDLCWFMVFNTTFNNISVISWQSVLLVEETRVPVENNLPVS